MIHVVVGDLASIEADAMVRPATSHLGPAAEATQLDRLAESPSWRPLPSNRPLDVGAAVVTDGGSLAADYVVHAVVSSPTKPLSGEGVRRALQSVLERTNDWEFDRIATPVVGGGDTDLGLNSAARILIETIFGGSTATYPTEVCIVVDSEEDKSVVDAFLRSCRASES